MWEVLNPVLGIVIFFTLIYLYTKLSSKNEKKRK